MGFNSIAGNQELFTFLAWSVFRNCNQCIHLCNAQSRNFSQLYIHEKVNYSYECLRVGLRYLSIL